MRNTPLGFVRQQGFAATQLDRGLYTALMFQPRVIGGVVLIGAVTQSPWLFLTLSAGLWGWAKRVKKPLETTRRSVQENVRWAKERIA